MKREMLRLTDALLQLRSEVETRLGTLEEREVFRMTSIVLGATKEALGEAGEAAQQELPAKRTEAQALMSAVEAKRDALGPHKRMSPTDLFGLTVSSLWQLAGSLIRDPSRGEEYRKLQLMTLWMSVGSLGDRLGVLVVTMPTEKGDRTYSEGVRLKAAKDLTTIGVVGGWKVKFEGNSPYYVPSDVFAAGPSEYPRDPWNVVDDGTERSVLPTEIPSADGI